MKIEVPGTIIGCATAIYDAGKNWRAPRQEVIGGFSWELVWGRSYNRFDTARYRLRISEAIKRGHDDGIDWLDDMSDTKTIKPHHEFIIAGRHEPKALIFPMGTVTWETSEDKLVCFVEHVRTATIEEMAWLETPVGWRWACKR